MKLERITIENFRQYCGKQRVDFAKDDQKRVTVIHGINGAGKTSFFRNYSAPCSFTFINAGHVP